MGRADPTGPRLPTGPKPLVMYGLGISSRRDLAEQLAPWYIRPSRRCRLPLRLRVTGASVFDDALHPRATAYDLLQLLWGLPVCFSIIVRTIGLQGKHWRVPRRADKVNGE